MVTFIGDLENPLESLNFMFLRACHSLESCPYYLRFTQGCSNSRSLGANSLSLRVFWDCPEAYLLTHGVCLLNCQVPKVWHTVL